MKAIEINQHFLSRADWVDPARTVDRVNHGTSEEPGMVALTAYLNDKLPDLQAQHLPHGSSFRLVGNSELA